MNCYYWEVHVINAQPCLGTWRMAGKHHPRGRDAIPKTMVYDQKGTRVSKALKKWRECGKDLCSSLAWTPTIISSNCFLCLWSFSISNYFIFHGQINFSVLILSFQLQTCNNKPLSTEQTEVLDFPWKMPFESDFRTCSMLFCHQVLLVHQATIQESLVFLSPCLFHGAQSTGVLNHSTFPFLSIFIFSIFKGLIQMPFLNPFLSHCTFDNVSPFWTPIELYLYFSFSSVQLLSYVWLFATPWITAYQTSLSITNSRSLLKLMPIQSVIPSNHLILCHPLLPPIPPSIRVFSNESARHMRWPKYWSFSFSISPSNEHPGLISFRMD